MKETTAYRTHTCGQLRAADLGATVTLSGWVHRRRDHGGIIFIDLRDRHGLTQVAFDPGFDQQAWQTADQVRPEYVLHITGEVRRRPEGQANPRLATGEIEVYSNAVTILNAAQTPPFEIDQDKGVNEELRLTYRYLDLRHERLQKNLMLRYAMIRDIRSHMDRSGFIDVETPTLIKGTPEGAREYLIPARLYPGQFYVLPQSPQQLKQMLMVAGFDRYFQIARCYRDEDQRGDRQPEFTQLDVEMSFVNEKDVMGNTEELLLELTRSHAPDKKILRDPFPVLSWHEAMEKYGSDKPDIRFEMPITDVSEAVKGCGFKVFSGALEAGGVVKALRVEGGGKFTRSELDGMIELAKVHGARGLAYFVYEENNIKSPIRKFMTDDEAAAITAATGAKTGDVVFFGADSFAVACNVLGQVRLACADKLGLRDPGVFAYCWVDKFPMFEKDADTGRLAAMHHPFTRPLDEDRELLADAPEKARAQAYDIVLNGNEIGGGSIRIHEQDLQQQVFGLLGVSGEEAEKKFGHMLKAFSFGAPPHGGIAWGLDRLVMLFAGEANIREVIAFPMNQKAQNLMMDAPSPMPESLLKELGLKIV